MTSISFYSRGEVCELEQHSMGNIFANKRATFVVVRGLGGLAGIQKELMNF